MFDSITDSYLCEDDACPNSVRCRNILDHMLCHCDDHWELDEINCRDGEFPVFLYGVDHE